MIVFFFCKSLTVLNKGHDENMDEQDSLNVSMHKFDINCYVISGNCDNSNMSKIVWNLLVYS